MEIKVNKNEIRTAIYVRISTAQQKTDRQVVELMEYAKSHAIVVDEDDIFIDVISGFKSGEIRPQYSVLRQRVEDGTYDQILFSEFSRLDRKPSNLLKSIEYYQSKGVHLFFKKQNIWIRDKSDISTQIMVSVLAVMSQYEIELFVARGIDGKITAIKNRGINCGGFTAYGYSTNPTDKRLVINEEEAKVVQRIYQYYDEGRSSIYIADILNSEGIPTPYRTRIEESTQKRRAKGMEAKQYSRLGNHEEFRWRPSTINRMIKNTIYIGRREFKFFEPEPSNPLPSRQRSFRKLFQEFFTQSEELRIIDDALFKRVNDIVEGKAFNRNLGIRHLNLLKDLMRCGECGGNFSVSGGLKEGRKYRCYGTVKRHEKPRTCECGAEIRMDRLDGLVLNMCINKFANHDIEKEATERIAAARKMLEEKMSVIAEYQQKMKEESDRFSAFARRVIKNAADDDEANAWIAEERHDYDARLKEMTDSIGRARSDADMYKEKIGAYTKMKRKANLVSRQRQILQDRTLVREYVRGFICRIELYRVSRLWALVVVKFIDGGERWGTIKTVRYKKSEVIADVADPDNFEYTGLFINNDRHLLSYSKEHRLISISAGHELHSGATESVEQLTFEEFKSRAEGAGFLGSYPRYQYEIQPDVL